MQFKTDFLAMRAEVEEDESVLILLGGGAYFLSSLFQLRVDGGIICVEQVHNFIFGKVEIAFLVKLQNAFDIIRYLLEDLALVESFAVVLALAQKHSTHDREHLPRVLVIFVLRRGQQCLLGNEFLEVSVRYDFELAFLFDRKGIKELPKGNNGFFFQFF